MKILIRPHETTAFPAWPFVGFGLAVLAGVGGLFRLLPARFSPPCGFHLAFGHPCPSCGVTRMGWAMMRGDLVGALRLHPFFFVVLSSFGLWFAAGLVLRLAGRDLFLVLSPREERWGWVLFAVAFLLNWVYLWYANI